MRRSTPSSARMPCIRTPRTASEPTTPVDSRMISAMSMESSTWAVSAPRSSFSTSAARSIFAAMASMSTLERMALRSTVAMIALRSM